MEGHHYRADEQWEGAVTVDAPLTYFQRLSVPSHGGATVSPASGWMIAPNQQAPATNQLAQDIAAGAYKTQPATPAKRGHRK